MMGHKSSTPVKKRSTECNVNNNCDEDLLEISEVVGSPSENGSLATMTPTSSQGSNEEMEMGKLYEAIGEQKDVIMKCLDSDQCDINALNEQIEVLQSMQQK